MSTNNLEQLAAAQKANAEVMMALVRTAFNGMEQLAALNLAASRELFNTSVANTQQLLTIKDPQELAKAGEKPNATEQATAKSPATAGGCTQAITWNATIAPSTTPAVPMTNTNSRRGPSLRMPLRSIDNVSSTNAAGSSTRLAIGL